MCGLRKIADVFPRISFKVFSSLLGLCINTLKGCQGEFNVSRSDKGHRQYKYHSYRKHLVLQHIFRFGV